MIKSFKSENLTSDEFLTKVKDKLSERDLGKIVNVAPSNSGEEVIIKFNKLGTSELVYNLKKNEKGFECTHKSEKLAITHRALRKEMETKFSGVLEKLGATVELG